MFNFRPDLHWLGSLFGRPDEEEVPGFRFKPPEDDVPGFRVKPPHEQVPGFRMNADGSINEAEATTARRYSGPGGNPSDFFEQASPGANAFTPVADKPPWGGWECRHIRKTTTTCRQIGRARRYATWQTFVASSLETEPIQKDTLDGFMIVVSLMDSAKTTKTTRTALAEEVTTFHSRMAALSSSEEVIRLHMFQVPVGEPVRQLDSGVLCSKRGYHLVETGVHNRGSYQAVRGCTATQ